VFAAYGQIQDKEAALTSGADDFVAKPVNAEDLRLRVAAILKVRRIRQDLDRTLASLHELEAARHAQPPPSLASVVVESPSVPPTAPTKIPILLVDDEALTRHFYGDLLGEHGFQVIAAKNGAEGAELARQHPVEDVILDVTMPGMSGLQVLERLRKRDSTLPVITLTADPSSQNAIAALKLGAFDFIIKGLAHDLVVLALRRAARHRRETITQRQQVAQLRARVAELEANRAQSSAF
jgi:DNA-binding response OmpR family regulator